MSSAQNSRGSVAAFGFRVKSGWASAILLNGPLKAPVVLSRWNVLMSDPKIPETKQPYHASTGVLEERSTIISKRVRIIRNATRASVRALLRESRNAGLKIRIAGLVVGSTIEPQSIGNPHIRAHAFEGQLFRTVLSEALKTHGIPVSVFVERDVFARASNILRKPETRLRQALLEMGRLHKPWSANEKLAALAAWVALTRTR